MNPDTLAYIERPAEGAPQGLLLLLHGVGADERSLADLALRQDPRLHVILPRAPLAFGPGMYGWFQVRFIGRPGDPARTGRSQPVPAGRFRRAAAGAARHRRGPQRGRRL